MKTATDFRLALKEIADELPAESQARGFVLDAIDKMNAIFPLDPNHLEVMEEPSVLIQKAYHLVEDVRLKAKLHFALMVTEHMLKKSGTP
jgi:hypothetical protein